MSQIELIMSAALGFAFAALIALLVGRLVWSYSASRGRRRTQRSGTNAMAELTADRDRLKVELAVLARRSEMQIEELKTRLAEQTADLARHRNQLDGLVAELGDKTELLRRREIELSQFREQLAPLESELATRTQALQQLKAQQHRTEPVEPLLPMPPALAESPALPLFEAAELPGLTPEAAQADPGLQHRVSSRIAELSELARQIEVQRQELLREQAELMALKDGMARGQKRRRRKEDGAQPTRKAPAVRKSRARGLGAPVEASPAPPAHLPPESPADAGESQVEAAAAATPAAEDGEPAPAVNGTEAVPPETAATPPVAAANGEAPVDAAAEDGATVITLASRIRALQRGAQG
jgi:hypothetical protein